MRAGRLMDPPPRVYFESLGASTPRAEQSLVLEGGTRFHGLDGEAYMDPKGFWVKGGGAAELALEPGGAVVLRNGGASNVVVVRGVEGVDRLELEPWQETSFVVPDAHGVGFFRVESEGGFRPSELDPANPDYRYLGVFVAARGF